MCLSAGAACGWFELCAPSILNLMFAALFASTIGFIDFCGFLLYFRVAVCVVWFVC